jgi:S-adenosylmethionine synthetase
MSLIPVTYTVESVTSGHPDKLCDLIADSLLDAYLTNDPTSRVAIEVLGSRHMIHLAGEVTSRATVVADAIVRRVLTAAGYSAQAFTIHADLTQQSPEIARGVDQGGAGDQGVMYGFATNETAEMLPTGVVLAHGLTRTLDELRSRGTLSWLKPDGKSQVTIRNGQPTEVVVSAQHAATEDVAAVRATFEAVVVRPVLTAQGCSTTTVRLHLNPAGPFTIGGFDSDTGLTGRKTQVDSYGGVIPHGGGAFSGKDPTKVDRSAAYMARFAAKQLVHQGLADECLVSVAYAIGVEEPVMLEAVDQAGRSLTGPLTAQFDFRPRAISERLTLQRPIYTRATNAGHFGRADLPWEQLEG